MIFFAPPARRRGNRVQRHQTAVHYDLLTVEPYLGRSCNTGKESHFATRFPRFTPQGLVGDFLSVRPLAGSIGARFDRRNH
jgi:hypothetical protein